MALSSWDWVTIDRMLAVVETGKLPTPDAYGTATVLADGAGISYGLHQGTDRGGTLDAIVMRYLDLGGAFAEQFRAYLPRLAANETAALDPKALPRWCSDLMELLGRAARQDALMRRAQDEVFRERYALPAESQAASMGLSFPLSIAVVYDTCVQSGSDGVARIRSRFPEVPPARGGDERAWTAAYVRARRAWLAGYSSGNAGHDEAVHRSVYRMDWFQAVIAAGNWRLCAPFKWGSVTIPDPTT